MYTVLYIHTCSYCLSWSNGKQHSLLKKRDNLSNLCCVVQNMSDYWAPHLTLWLKAHGNSKVVCMNLLSDRIPHTYIYIYISLTTAVHVTVQITMEIHQLCRSM